MDISQLVNLTARAWAPTILVLMAEGVPGRQAVLLARSGAPRSAFAGSMLRLIELGLVQRNPGHGHPLRPEFVLTQDGRAIAPRFSAALRAIPNDSARLLRRTWSLPILCALDQPRGFSALSARLPAVTDRALSQGLKLLTPAGLLSREVDSAAHPPRVRYARAPLGARVAAPLADQIVWS